MLSFVSVVFQKLFSTICRC